MPTFVCDHALLADGFHADVRIDAEDGIITGVTPDAGRQRLSAQAGVHHLRGFVLPGVANLHSHAFQRAMAGLTECRGGDAAGEDSFWTWREVMYRFVARLTPDDIEAIAAQAYVEMLEAGFTTVAEFHYLHHQPDGTPYADIAETAGRIAAAASATGIGLTLLPVFYAHGGFGPKPAALRQAPFLNSPARFEALLAASGHAIRTLPAAQLGLAIHSLRAATLSEIAALLAMAPRGPVHMHIAEQEQEVADCLALHGRRPVELLLDAVDLDHRWCLIHATHMTKSETQRLAASGAIAGLCPVTEANLGDGIFPAADFLAAGGAFGIGSDSNVLISAAEELRTLEYGQRLRDRRRNRLAAVVRGDTEPARASAHVGHTLVQAALAGGARAAGRAVGALAPGHSCDLVVLDATHPSLCGLPPAAILDGWIFACASSPIDEVWVRGERLVASGRHKDRDAIAGAYRKALAGVMRAV